ncbi:MAG TPA: DUF4166 domain-containing protein [Patescibacteria group bacterium]|nr:DUF4166 domain-containing protein [Patescibacteria group bacterium]
MFRYPSTPTGRAGSSGNATSPADATPAIECTETGDGERFVFDIDVAFPLVGPVVHYRGWLVASPRMPPKTDLPPTVPMGTEP